MKLFLDKYFTPIELANYCWDLIDEVIGLKNIDIIIDSSVGGGAFCNYKKRKPDILVDIEPDKEEYNGIKVIKADFTKWVRESNVNWLKKNVLVGFNPPYGERNHLLQKFFKSCVGLAKWITYIMPINQLNNSYTFKDYKLIKSVDLGINEYSGVKLHCCFNIYEKPSSLYEKLDITKIESSDIKIIRHDEGLKKEVKSSDIGFTNTVAGGKHSKKYDELEDYDIRFVYFGSGCAGKIFDKGQESKTFAGEYKIKIDDGNKDKQKILDFIKTYDWNGNCKSISMKRISKQDILNELNKRFDINQTRERNIFDYISEMNGKDIKEN